MPKRIVITSGEPAGIGPDILIQLSGQFDFDDCIILGDKQLFAERAAKLKLPCQLPIEHIPLNEPVIAGQLNPANAGYVVKQLRIAAEHDKIVTSPVHKGVINDAGITFSGHTEYFANITQTKDVVMMLAFENFRVALATTHCPLKTVAESINPVMLKTKLAILKASLQKQFHIANPRIKVLGLNPHAGESGHLGREEIDIINPAIQSLNNPNITGPYSADTVFSPKRLQDTDAFFAMYHDQGLPVLKFAGFNRIVNITLGLPFVRTSVDHGTALDIAGTGQASSESLACAIALARQLQ